MNREDLQFIVRAAIAAHDIPEIHRLFERCGLVAFSQALAPWSSCAVADGLSMLSRADRAAAIRHLPAPVRARLQSEGLLPDRALPQGSIARAGSPAWSAA